MKILVINCGSSSLKYQLIDMKNEDILAKGLVERIGMEGAILTQKVNGEKYKIEEPMKDHEVAIKLVLGALIDKTHGVITNMNEINAVGHRVLHGGQKYSSSVLINSNVMDAIQDCVKLGPLHNPANIIGINACEALMPGTPQVAVFDTAFHQTLPDYAYIYALPYDLYEKDGIRKYGFHGTSHRFVSARAAEMLGKDIKDVKTITCHLGNGASLCAIDGGKSVETSMGFTPLAGIVMGTRCGDIDPAIVTYLMKELKMSPEKIDDLLNKKSGVLGISGLSSDFRDLEAESGKGNKRAKLALDIYYYQVKKLIGAYSAVLSGADCLVFTAGLGENSSVSRKAICAGLEFLGVEICDERNDKAIGKEALISTDKSKVKVLVIPTDEEMMIARDTKEIVEK